MLTYGFRIAPHFLHGTGSYSHTCAMTDLVSTCTRCVCAAEQHFCQPGTHDVNRHGGVWRKDKSTLQLYCTSISSAFLAGFWGWYALCLAPYHEILHFLAWCVEGCEWNDAFGGLNPAVRPNIPCETDAIPFLQFLDVRGCHGTSTSAESSSAPCISASRSLFWKSFCMGACSSYCQAIFNAANDANGLHAT